MNIYVLNERNKIETKQQIDKFCFSFKFFIHSVAELLVLIRLENK